MITCLSGYFGLKGVHVGYPRYINELPGFRTSTLDDIKDDEDTLAEAWSNIYDRANRKLEQDITNALKKYFRKYQILNTTITSNVDTNTQLTSSSNYVGWLFDNLSWNKNTKLIIEKVNFFLSTAQSGTLYIFDATLGTQLYNKAFTGAAGVNQVVVNQEFATYKYSRIFVCYDASEIQPYKTSDYDFGGFSTISRQSVPKTSSVVKDNFVSSECGLVVTYNSKCSVDNFVCHRLSIFTEPFLYALGIEFLRECRDSLEVNRHTLLDTDQREAQIMDFKEIYKEYLDNALYDLRVTDNDECFICTKAITKKAMIP